METRVLVVVGTELANQRLWANIVAKRVVSGDRGDRAKREPNQREVEKAIAEMCRRGALHEEKADFHNACFTYIHTPDDVAASPRAA